MGKFFTCDIFNDFDDGKFESVKKPHGTPHRNHHSERRWMLREREREREREKEREGEREGRERKMKCTCTCNI